MRPGRLDTGRPKAELTRIHIQGFKQDNPFLTYNRELFFTDVVSLHSAIMTMIGSGHYFLLYLQLE